MQSVSHRMYYTNPLNKEGFLPLTDLIVRIQWCSCDRNGQGPRFVYLWDLLRYQRLLLAV